MRISLSRVAGSVVQYATRILRILPDTVFMGAGGHEAWINPAESDDPWPGPRLPQQLNTQHSGDGL